MIPDFSTYSDAELKALYETIKYDLETAAEEEPDSEWHQSCFAALALVTEETKRRWAH